MKKFNIVCKLCGSTDIDCEPEEVWVEHEYVRDSHNFTCTKCGNKEHTDTLDHED